MTPLVQAILYPLIACVAGGVLFVLPFVIVLGPAAWFGAKVDRDPITGEIG